ncbi:twinkle mtDNA helicase isoform X1 [Dermacentor andersoni]|uniref:twinkle mtDNA helicase isoform X1 n=1 Tax=Dermacentor andersoni TaxID=34620 RepID=UPI00215504ED|nr:twinkle mtDNA helicase-like isoform X1 [Dermacentor andersoni]XP_054930295.1 twinkle mtDNA helicase-like isoform X1 [Dermacentor andersoni]
MAGKLMRYSYLLTKCPDSSAADMAGLTSGICGVSYGRYNYIMKQLHGMQRYSLALPKSFMQRRAMATMLSTSDVAPVTVSKIKKVLKDNSVGFEEGYICLKITCPICRHDPSCTEVQKSLPPTAFINIRTGLFTCYNCHVVTSWRNLQDCFAIEKTAELREQLAADCHAFPNKQEVVEVQSLYESSTRLADAESSLLKQIISRFGLQRIHPVTMRAMDVRLSEDKSSILFPIYGPAKRLVALKSVELADGHEASSVFPRPSVVGLFGWHRIKRGHHELILTASEKDALAVVQETNLPVASLLSGTSNLPLEVLPLFEQFDKITLWFGNRLQDWESVKVFARKLSEKRCYYIRPKEGYPLAALQATPQSKLPDVLKRCQPVSHRAITTFHSLRAAVADLLQNVDTFMGVPWQRFPALVRLLKGFRTGELTVFTGPTGSGKTTFMCEYSLDLCMQGVNTLWGSFEIQNEKLAKIMLTQFAKISLENNMEEFDSWADKFELLPLYFMTFHGEETMKNVMDAMSHAVYVHDIQHVVVDNVQFMMGVGMDNSNVDRFWRQDLLIAAFRRFATQHNCHVTLVMHPRKEKDSEELSTSSIFGGVKASQEADNVLILQDRRLTSQQGRKHLQVTKNRFDGDIGSVPLEFNKENLTFSESTWPFKNAPERKTKSAFSRSALPPPR